MVRIPRLFALIALLACFCNNPANDKGGGCTEPSTDCPSGNCTFAHVFDANNNFVAAPGFLNGSVAWDGKDCNGAWVPCGRYSVRVYSIVNGSRNMMTEDLMVADSGSVSRSGRTSCDSLKAACRGSYSEMISPVFDPDYGVYVNQVTCLCCQ